MDQESNKAEDEEGNRTQNKEGNRTQDKERSRTLSTFRNRVRPDARGPDNRNAKNQQMTDLTATNNSYSSLKNEEIVQIYFLAGESDLKHQGKQNKQQKKNRKVLCHPGATVQSITNQVRNLSAQREDLVVVHVGINNLCGQKLGHLFRSEAHKEKYKSLIETITSKTDNGIIAGIIMSMNETEMTYSRIKYINRAVKAYTTLTWKQFLKGNLTSSSLMEKISMYEA